jgi:tetratricopeptide (TPR) repeat protein
MAAILNYSGMCAWGEGDFKKARKFYEETLRLSRECQCEVLEAEAHNNLALLDWKDGRIEKALGNFQLCLGRWKKLHNRFALALTLMNIGIVEENLGSLVQARRHYLEALKQAKEVNFVQAQAATYSNLGNLALLRQAWAEALEYNSRGLELTRGIGDRRSQAIALENLTLTHLGLGKPEEARASLREACKIARDIGDRERLLSLDLVEIEMRLSRNDVEGIFERLEEARRQLDRRGYLAEWPRLLRLHAHAELLCGKEKGAKQSIKKAISECQKQKNRSEEKKIRALESEWVNRYGKND